MALVGKKGPEFRAPAVINGNTIEQNFSLQQYIGKQEVLFFFYPKDFTFVCPTEIISFQEHLEDFAARNVALVGASTDTEETHLAWLNTPINKGGIQGVTYPLVADTAKTIALNYGVLGGDWEEDEAGHLHFNGAPIAYRGTFLIDKQGIVRHETINDFPLGRNIDEYLRLVDALQYVEKNGEVCPANWSKGKKALKPTQEEVANYLTEAHS